MEQAKISSSQGTQSAHAARAKTTAQQGVDANDATGAGGFLALLAALDGMSEEGVVAGAVDTDVPPPDISAEGAATVMDVSAVAAWQGLFASQQSDASLVAGRPITEALRPDALVNGSVALNAQGIGGSGEPVLSEPVLGGLPQGLVAETTKLDTSADFKDGQPQGTVAGFGRIFSRMQSAQAQRAGGIHGSELSAGQIAAGDSTQRLSVAHGAAASALVQATSERSLAGQQHAGGAGAERGIGASGVPVGAEGNAPLVDSLLAGGASSRGAESSGGGRPSEGHAEGGAASPLELGNVDDAAVFADSNAMGSEEQVADQVAYWVNQKTQNAEMTLDRDGQPVEVSVSLSGNEAHVSFRSDQPQTRELLDQSMAQLRDLLRSEGLVLSGMSVGTSARDGAGASGGESGQSRQREGGRQAQVIASAPAGTSSLARGGGSSERAVDIFV